MIEPTIFGLPVVFKEPEPGYVPPTYVLGSFDFFNVKFTLDECLEAAKDISEQNPRLAMMIEALCQQVVELTEKVKVPHDPT